jgi:hypothetical protein
MSTPFWRMHWLNLTRAASCELAALDVEGDEDEPHPATTKAARTEMSARAKTRRGLVMSMPTRCRVNMRVGWQSMKS